MIRPWLKVISSILVIVFLSSFFVFGFFGTSRVEAGFWDNKGSISILTVLKGLIMIWIINLMNQNSGNSNEDLLTSTIKNGLNLNLPATVEDNQPSKQDEEVVIIEKSNLDELTVQERQIVDLVNNARVEQGLQLLSIDKDLVKVARMKAQDMIDNNYFDHQSPTYGSPFDMMKKEGIEYSLAGENLAGAKTVEKGFDSLMNSPDHKENILEPRYDKIGIGVIEGGPYGLMIVQEFIDSPDPTK